jgi:Fe-Mn family superoxide dismutase
MSSVRAKHTLPELPYGYDVSYALSGRNTADR